MEVVGFGFVEVAFVWVKNCLLEIFESSYKVVIKCE